MDGFVNNKDVTVIVMAASNRADVLDPAILRRFDRKVHVGYPNTDGRQAILRVHARRINMEDTVKHNEPATRQSSSHSSLRQASKRTFAAQVVMLAQSPDPSKPVHNRMTGIYPSSSSSEVLTIQFKSNFSYPVRLKH